MTGRDILFLLYKKIMIMYFIFGKKIHEYYRWELSMLPLTSQKMWLSFFFFFLNSNLNSNSLSQNQLYYVCKWIFSQTVNICISSILRFTLIK